MTHGNAKCRLCLQQKKLCNSHVIPEFFYKQMELYDDKHRFNILSTESGTFAAQAQKGIYERLLCQKCEGKLSQWEDYARSVLYGGECIEITTNGPNGTECIVDYEKFKLFQLSILWRIGISTHSGFSSISLGEHENVLRKMLIEESPGNEETYGCVIIHSSKNTNITSDMIHCMGSSNVFGVECARLLMGGSFRLFFISEKAICSSQKELFLQETGQLRILKTDKDPNNYIESLAKDLHCANPDRFNQFSKDR